MEESQREAIVNALFVMAWKDGKVTVEEKSVLDRILSRLGVPRGDIMRLIEERSREAPAEDELERVLPDHETRLQAMKYLIAVCFSDSQLATEELDYLYSLSVRLSIRADELEQLRLEAEKLVGGASPVTEAAGPTAGGKPSGVAKIKLD